MQFSDTFDSHFQVALYPIVRKPNHKQFAASCDTIWQIAAKLAGTAAQIESIFATHKLAEKRDFFANKQKA